MRSSIEARLRAEGAGPGSGPGAGPGPGAEGQLVLPGVPVLSRTLLAMELLWQREAFDLRAAATVIADDPGALLQMYGAAAEQGCAADRLEICLAGVRPEQLLAQMAAARVDRATQRRMGEFAEHAVRIARRSVAVAEVLGLPGELARQVGLLHELGRLPAILGWAGAADRSTAAWCERLAAGYGLPPALAQAVCEACTVGAGSIWTVVVRTAHELPASGLVQVRDVAP